MAKIKEQWVIQKFKNRVYLGIIFLELIVIIFCLGTITRMSVTRKVVVEIPPIAYDVVVGDKAYIKWWGRYFINLVSDFSPINYEDRLNTLLLYASSRSVEKIRIEGLRKLKDVKKMKISQTFYPVEGTWEVKRLTKYMWRVSVKGILKAWQGKAVQELKVKYFADIIFTDRVYLERFGYEEAKRINK